MTDLPDDPFVTGDLVADAITDAHLLLDALLVTATYGDLFALDAAVRALSLEDRQTMLMALVVDVLRAVHDPDRAGRDRPGREPRAPDRERGGGSWRPLLSAVVDDGIDGLARAVKDLSDEDAARLVFLTVAEPLERARRRRGER